VDRRVVTDSVLHEPGSITTNDGDPYSVFTYYGRKWQERPKDDPYEPPEAASPADVNGDPLPAGGTGLRRAGGRRSSGGAVCRTRATGGVL